MQEKYKYGLWGVAAGAITLALVGFTWGGWVTGSTAKMQAEAAGWTALPVCADAILANPAALAELKTKRATDYDDVVRDHLKMIAGRGDMSFAFRRDCGKTIEATDAVGRCQKLRLNLVVRRAIVPRYGIAAPLTKRLAADEPKSAEVTDGHARSVRSRDAHPPPPCRVRDNRGDTLSGGPKPQ
jgi:hypothetical protein